MTSQNHVHPSPDGLAAAARAGTRKGAPPLHLWNPPDCGDIDMRIARDGTWFYQGTPIGRRAMVRLFASILRREGDRYVLVTPVEKVGITVDDVPFIAVDVQAEGDPAAPDHKLSFETALGDRVTAGPDHPLRVEIGADGEPAPYIHIRDRLEARIDRKSFYRLVDLGITAPHEGQDWFGLWSAGVFFPVLPADALPQG